MELNPLENEKCLFPIEKISDNEKILLKMGANYEGIHNYSGLLKSITDKIEWILESGYEDYQGDLYWLGKDDNDNYYFLQQGYGSCSGCDALQSANGNYEALDRLRDGMKRNIIKFCSLQEFKEYIVNVDRQYSHYYYSGDFISFIKKLDSYFGWEIETMIKLRGE